MPEIDESSVAPDFKPWRIGEPYNFPLPKYDGGDPWKLLLEKRKRADYGRCEVWKDEVQNLLIFAGLFSAVVTAFVVESYTTLQEDPCERMVLLLNQISVQLRDPLSSNVTLVPGPGFSPKSSDLRVNIFWFLSLIFSLVTVLVGILSLQWLREYQRSRNIESRQAYALHHMHTESLDAWYMPEIFASLPLLLQLALVLFFIGLCDFASGLNRFLAIPIIVIIILALIFLIVTTVLPTLQATALFYRRRDEKNLKPRVPCPYNSPQAWAFHRLICLLYSLPSRLHLWFPLTNGQIENIFKAPILRHGFGWTDPGVGWLFQRDADYINATVSRSANSLGRLGWIPMVDPDTPPPIIALYDSTKALMIARDTMNPSTDQAELAALYACAAQLVDSTSGELCYNIFGGHSINPSCYMEALLTSTDERTILHTASDPDISPLLDDLNFVSFFFGNLSLIRGDNSLRNNLIERSVRLTEWVYGQREMRRMVLEKKYSLSRYGSFSTPLYAAWSLVENGEQLYGLEDQVAVIIRRFFETVLAYQLPALPECLSHTSSYVEPFLYIAATMLFQTESASAVACNEGTLNMIADWLHQSRHQGINGDFTKGDSEPLPSPLHASTSLKQQYVFTMALIYGHVLMRVSRGLRIRGCLFKLFTSQGFASLQDVLKTIYEEQVEQAGNAFYTEIAAGEIAYPEFAFPDEIAHGQIAHNEIGHSGAPLMPVTAESTEVGTNTRGYQVIEGENPEETAKQKAWKEHLKEMLRSAHVYSKDIGSPEGRITLFDKLNRWDHGYSYTSSISSVHESNSGQQEPPAESGWRDEIEGDGKLENVLSVRFVEPPLGANIEENSQPKPGPRVLFERAIGDDGRTKD